MWKIYVIVGVLCLTSCNEHPEVRRCVQEYLEEMANYNLKNANINPYNMPGDAPKTMRDYNCYGYSSYKITDIINRGDTLFKAIVEIASPKREIALLVERDSINKENLYKVIDSWNFLDLQYSEKDYEFAKKTGCLPDGCFTDLEVEERMGDACLMKFDYINELEDKIKSQIKVLNQNWNKGYGNYASGSAIIYNGSPYSFKGLEYVITFSDIDGKTTTKDKGIISYERFSPGDYKSISFYNPNVGNAEYAHILPVFNEDFLYNEVMQATYTGTEFVNFLKKKPYIKIERSKW